MPGPHQVGACLVTEELFLGKPLGQRWSWWKYVKVRLHVWQTDAWYVFFWTHCINGMLCPVTFINNHKTDFVQGTSGKGCNGKDIYWFLMIFDDFWWFLMISVFFFLVNIVVQRKCFFGVLLQQSCFLALSFWCWQSKRVEIIFNVFHYIVLIFFKCCLFTVFSWGPSNKSGPPNPDISHPVVLWGATRSAATSQRKSALPTFETFCRQQTGEEKNLFKRHLPRPKLLMVLNLGHRDGESCSWQIAGQ